MMTASDSGVGVANSEQAEVLTKLRSEESETIREGAFGAGDMACVEAVPLLAEHLKSQNLGVQEAADIALRKIGGRDAVAAVIPLLRSDNVPARNMSMDILREVGGQDVEALIGLLHDEDADIRIFISDILGSAGTPQAVRPLGESLLKDPECNVRYQAAVSLGSLAYHEGAAYLNKALADEEWVQFAVIEALTKIRDGSSVNALAKALDSSSDLVASMIVDALGEMGNIKVATVLLQRMDASPTPLRNKIVKAVVDILGSKSLGFLSEGDRKKLKTYLLEALEDEDKEIQDASMRGLTSLDGEEAVVAVLRLTSGMDPERDRDRMEKAVDCLAGMGMNRAFEDAVRNGDLMTMLLAVEAIKRMQGTDTRTLLMETFWDKDRDVQREMVQALVNMAGPEDSEFFLDILDRHEDGSVIKGALHFLGDKVGTEDVGDRLFAMLDHPWDDVKEAALEACIAVGGKTMKDRFIDGVASDEPVTRMMSVYAVGKLGSPADAEAVKGALEDSVPDVRKVALEALGEIGGGSPATVRLIESRLADECRDVRVAAVELLGEIGGEDAIRCLLHALVDGDDWVRIRAVESLEAFPESGEVIPRLVSLLEDENTLVVLKAVEVLGRVGGEAAFNALLRLLDQGEPEIQAAAEEALAVLRTSQGGEG